MKYLLMLIATLAMTDRAHAGEENPVVGMIEAHLKKMSQLNVFALKMPPALARALERQAPEKAPEAPPPQSCDLSFNQHKEKMELNYSCDPKRSLRTDLNIAAN